MRVASERLGHDLLELRFDLVDCFSWSETRAIADPEDVSIDGEGLLAKCSVQDDVRGLAANAGERLELVSRPGNFAAVVVDQRLAEQDDVLRLGIEQADRLDRVAERFFAELNHLLRSLDVLEQWLRRDVDAGVRRLGGQDDRDEQLVRISGLELRRWRRVRLGKPAEELEDLIALHSEPMTSRIE